MTIVSSAGKAQVPAQGCTRARSPAELRRKALYLLLLVIASGVILNGLANQIWFRYLRPPLAADLQTGVLDQEASLRSIRIFITARQGEDSLRTMYPAIQLLTVDRRAPIYRTIFFTNHIKFQYSPASLLPYYVLTRWGASYDALLRISRFCTWGSVWGVLFLTVVIVLRVSGIDPWNVTNWRSNAWLVFAVALAALFFDPLIFAFDLGQIQTLLTLGFTAAFYCWMTGREKTAGALIGVMVLVKPQYALFLVWALLRKKYGAAASCAVCFATGMLVSCIVFGWHNNIAYLAVLKVIGSTGETFAANQSMNGLLNRLLFNGDNVRWHDLQYPPFNPLVYAGTLISAVILLGTALFHRWEQRRGRVADFAAILLASTAASPIAWDHHYAILTPILAWMWFGDYAWRGRRRDTVLFALAYMLTANYFLPALALASVPVANILESYMYFGALLVFILLLNAQVEAPPQPAPAMPEAASADGGKPGTSLPKWAV
ncbi:MAG: glycosyltransferase family 87 protein [Terracidiphilus sp.]